MQYKVDIDKMRLVEVIKHKPQVEWFKSEAAPDVEFNKAYMNWLDLSKNQKSYPILASDLQYWQPLDGKIVGEGDFEVKEGSTPKEHIGNDVYGQRSTTYAIPIQPKEQGEPNTPQEIAEWAMTAANRSGGLSLSQSVRIMDMIEALLPATPASSDVWEEAEREADLHALRIIGVHRDWMTDEDLVTYYTHKLSYLEQHYSLTKKPQ